MKTHKRKLHRIVAMVCAGVMLATNIFSSPNLFVQAGENDATLEPIGVVFNTQEKVDEATFYDNNWIFDIKKTLKEDTEKKYVSIECTPNEAGELNLSYSNFISQSGNESIQLEDYPFMRISYRYTPDQQLGWESMMFMATGSESTLYDVAGYNASMNETPDGTWKDIVLDFANNTYTIYNEAGEVEVSTRTFADRIWEDTWEGTATSLMINPVYGVTTHTVYDIAYIVLFNSKEEALTYPNTPAKVALEEALDNMEFTAEYENASTIETATAIAKTQIQAVIDAQETTSGRAATFTMSNSEIGLSSTQGIFSSDVTISMPGSITFVYKFSMTLTGRKAPITVVFDTQKKVDEATFYDNSGTFEITKTLKEDTEKKYVSIECTPKGTSGLDLHYENFISQSGNESIQLEDYPYMKISYRYTPDKPLTYESMMFMATGSEGTLYDVAGYNASMNATPDGTWKDIVLDFANNKYTIYNEAGEAEVTTRDFADRIWEDTWEGTATSLMINPVYGVTTHTVYDIAYIVLFATEAEALTYPSTIDQDREALLGTTFKCASEDVSTADAAYAELTEQIAALGLKNEYTIENGVFTAATEDADGSYSADVVFNSANKVSVTMTITKPLPVQPDPIIWTFDNTAVLSQFSGTNAKMVYENGYMKMTTTNSTYDDGFFIAGSMASDEQFDVSTYPYFKIKYKINGAESAPIQLYYWLENGSAYSGSAYANDPSWEGDTVTLIANITEDSESETAIWMVNEDTGATKTVKYYDSDLQSSGRVKSIRINLARQKYLDRTAEVEYMGYFASYDAAVAYEGAAQERIDVAVEYLEKNSLDINWGLACTQEKAVQNVISTVEQSGVGCTVGNVSSYVPASTTSKGSITFDATLKSAEVSKVVENLTVTINKKPSEPIVWRFNDSEFVNKLSLANVKTSIENNVMKMVSTAPLNDDGFYFMVNLPEDTEQFYLEDYPYIRLKYMREGAGAAQLYYFSDAFVSGSPDLGQFGYGQVDGDWYTTILDANNRDYVNPVTYNYNHNTGEEEQLTRVTSYVLPSTPWKGLASHFRFNFGRIRNTDRTLYLEYIAFFPTIEEARAYDEENERLKANAELALRDYASSTVDYYEGHTEEEAKETALEKLSALLGDEVEIVINKVSYTAPVKNTSNGMFKFTADICNLDGEVLYTTGEYTLNISAVVNTDPIVFSFTNPKFIARVEGTKPQAIAYTSMGLTDDLATSFTLPLKGEEQFYTNGHAYIALKINAEASNSKLVLNGVPYDLGALASGETMLVIDITSGKIYKDGTEVSGVTITGIPLEKVKTLGMQFNDTSVNVYDVAFFTKLTEALAYDGTSALLAEKVAELNRLNLKCAYTDAKTKEEALAFAMTKVEALLGNEVQLVSEETTLVSYDAATTEQNGTITFRVLVGVGNEVDSHYDSVELTMSIAKKPSQAIVWTFDSNFVRKLGEGHNVTLKSENNILIMDTKDSTTTNGFHFTVNPSRVGSDFYLQDYKYVKFKYRYHSDGTYMGTAQFYFWSDEVSGHSRDYSIGKMANQDTWCSALMDLEQNTFTICDLENSTLLSSTSLADTSAYRGKPTEIRVDMANFTTGNRHAEIEYIAFFTSREEAEAYNGDYCYTSHEFNGLEYATAEDNLTVAPKTIETAVRITETQNVAMTIVSNKQADIDNYYALETTADGKVRFVYLGKEVLLSDTSIYDGKWHNIAVTLADGSAVLYIDGVAVKTNNTFEVASGMSLKAPVMASDYTKTTPFVGMIYYARLYSSVLTKEQLAENAFNKNAKHTDGLFAGWFTDKLVGSEQFADVCGVNPMTIGDNYGKKGHEFLGEDYIKTEKKLTATPKTFEFWMKAPVSTTEGTYTILSNKTEGSSTGTTIELVDGQLRMVSNGTELFITEGLSLSDHIWTHVAITLGETVNLYLDGEKVTVDTVAYTANDASKNAYYIGASLENAKTPFIGSLSDVRIWCTEKTQAAIKSNMLEYPENAEELLGSWRLDTQVYLEYTDYSSNQNTGTLYSSGWYKLDSIHGDYSLGAIGDTQSYMFGNHALFTETFANLADKIDDFKMKHLFHLGDVTQVDSAMEWSFTRNAYDQIEGLVPYTIVQGNHDYPSPSSGKGAEIRNSVNFNAAFPRDQYLNQKNFIFGGSYDETNSINIYNFLNVGGVEYIIFGLEYVPRDDVLTWVSEVLDQYPNKRAIILTHAYLASGGGSGTEWGDLATGDSAASGDDFKTANDGDDIWDKLLSKHNNIAMLLCGHSQNPFVVYREDRNDYGKTIVQMMVDHSNVAQDFPSTQGLMTILSFTNDGKMHTYWYSPLYDAYYQTDNEVTFDMSDALYGDTNIEATRTTYAKKYDEIKEYRGTTYTAPQADKYGYIFAGWYEDEELTTTIATTTTEGEAYAKFVDKDVLTVKSQVALDGQGNIPTDKASLRFVTTVDSLNYSKVGFKIEMQLDEAAGLYTSEIDTYDPNDANANYVYEELYAMGSDSETITYEPKNFSQSSYRFKAWNLNDIPVAQYGTQFRAKAYWVTLDGTMVEGRTSLRSINDAKEVLQ